MADLAYTTDLLEKSGLRPSRQAIKRAALALAVALGIAGAADFGYGYLTTGRYLESTDDAYVKADSTIVAPRVSGYIADVLVADNQKVEAGQLLARIDDRDFRTALSQAHADVAASEAAVRNLDAQIALQEPVIEQGTADVAAAEASLQFAQQEQTRYDGLMKSGSGTVQRAQQTDAELREKAAQLQHGKSGLLAAQKKVDVLTTERAKAVAQLDHARAVEAQAALNLSYTEISAPVDGTVDRRRYLGVGQVQRGLGLDRAGVIQLRHRLGALGGEHVDFLLRGQQPGLAVLQLGGFLAQFGVGLLRALHRTGAGLHQAVVAGLFLLRELQGCLGGGDIGGALFDDRLLQRDLRIEVAHGGFGSRHIGVGLDERRAEIASVEP